MLPTGDNSAVFQDYRIVINHLIVIRLLNLARTSL